MRLASAHLAAVFLSAWLSAGLAAGAIGLGGCGHGSRAVAAPAAAETAAPDDLVAAGKRVVEQYRQAYEVKSMDALAPLYAQGLDTVLVQQGKALFGWTAVEAHLKETVEGASAIHIRVGDVAVAAVGSDGAAVTAAMTREMTEGSTTVQESGILTLSLHRDGERWLIVAEHYSFAR
jgi:ketosteroid isomerase-like protein